MYCKAAKKNNRVLQMSLYWFCNRLSVLNRCELNTFKAFTITVCVPQVVFAYEARLQYIDCVWRTDLNLISVGRVDTLMNMIQKCML